MCENQDLYSGNLMTVQSLRGEFDGTHGCHFPGETDRPLVVQVFARQVRASRESRGCGTARELPGRFLGEPHYRLET